MTHNERHLKGPSEASWLFIRAGVAAAILKSKPSGMSGRERAEQLARVLMGREESWQHRAHELQHELLRLQQELFITKGASSSEAAGHGDAMDDASQDLFGPGSETGCDSETPELMQPDLGPAAAPLPDPPGGPALPHVHFLQSLCALQRVREGERGLEPLWFGPEGDAAGSLLAESVCRLMDSVVAACRAPPPLLGAGEPVMRACRVAARAMDLFCSRRTPSAEFTGHVEDALRELTKLLLHRDQLSRLQSSERLMEYLITLGSSSMLTTFLIRHLLSLISDLADQLQQSFQVFGNHEFDNGVDGLMAPFMQQIQCPVLSANIRVDQTLASTFGRSFLPYKIFTVGGEKVGVVGYTSRETPHLSQPGPHVVFLDEVESLQLQVNKLQTLGVHKVVALGHSGFTVDRLIAERVRGVDVVIGGHSNTFLYTGTPPSSEVPAGPYPFMVTSADGRQVPVVQAYAFGKYLGYLEVTFDEAGNVLKASGNPILLDSSVPQDPEVLADVEQWKKNLANYSAQAVGTTQVFLNGSTEECRFRECNLGNLICDAMVDNSMRRPDGLQWNHVSAAIFNGGGVRSSIDERTRDGSITMEDLISVLPFGGTFDLVQLKGSTLFKAFEHSVRRYGQSTGEFLQVSGFQVAFDLSGPPGRRVQSLAMLCTRCRVPRYEAVQQEALYRVVLPSYMLTGGDGFSMIAQEALKHDSGDLDISVVSNYIAQKKSVYPAVEGRIRIYNSASGLVPLVPLVPLLWAVCWTV